MKKTLKLLLATPMYIIYIAISVASGLLFMPARLLKKLSKGIEHNFLKFQN